MQSLFQFGLSLRAGTRRRIRQEDCRSSTFMERLIQSDDRIQRAESFTLRSRNAFTRVPLKPRLSRQQPALLNAQPTRLSSYTLQPGKVACPGSPQSVGFPCHAHMLRHAAGYYWSNARKNARDIQLWLRHKNIQHIFGIVSYARPAGKLSPRLSPGPVWSS
jgi:integrase